MRGSVVCAPPPPPAPQLVAEALHANSHVVQQLQLQHVALLTHRFSVGEADFPGGKDVYIAYR